MLFHNMIFFSPMVKKIWTKHITHFLTTSFEGLYFQEYSNESKSNANSTIDIIVGGDHFQGKF